MSLRLRRLLATIAVAAVLAAGAGVGAVWAATRFVAGAVPGDRYVLLVLGSDMGPPRAGSALRGRADAIQLLVVAPRHRRVAILSFPRDTLAAVPGRGRTKLNAALTRGPDVAVQAVEQLTGITVDDWIVTGFSGFIFAVDAIGGLTVDVEQRLFDPRGASTDLQPGVQRLTGWGTLGYVRDRKSRPGGDLGRAAAQAKVLATLHRRFVSEQPSLARVAELARILSAHTATSIPPERLFRLAGLALSIPPENVDRVVLDGRVGSAGGASVVRLTDQALRTIADVRADGVLGTAP